MLFSLEPTKGLRLKWARRGDDGVAVRNTAIDSGSGAAVHARSSFASDRTDVWLVRLMAGAPVHRGR